SPCNVTLRSALNEAYHAGVLVVAAAGNLGAKGIVCPANHPTVISVGASNSEGTRAYYSNFDDTLDLLAPGGDSNSCASAILAPTINGGVSCVGGTPFNPGTSFATPHVSGVVALMLAHGAVRGVEEA